ncbi:thioredoxin-like protein [Cryomyces antarcticus]
MASLKVYGDHLSPYLTIVKLVLAEKGIDFQLVPISLYKAEQKTPEFLKLNPWGKVPVMEDEDGPNGMPLVLAESRAISIYLAKKYWDAGTPLMPDPSDPAAIGRFSEAMLAETLYIGTPAIEVAVEKFIKPARGLALNDAALDALRATLRTNFAVVDRILATRPYMAGDEYGLVDIFYTPSIHLLERSGEIGVMEGLKHLASWWAKDRSRQ